jgi:3-methyladenine DNA glycosylase AlkD
VIVAKTRKAASAKKKTAPARKPGAKKSMAKKSAGGKKKTGRKAASKKATSHVDFRPLKKQIKAHVEMLSRAKSGDKRVSDAIASLRRVHMELDEHCDPTMTIPLA